MLLLRKLLIDWNHNLLYILYLCSNLYIIYLYFTYAWSSLLIYRIITIPSEIVRRNNLPAVCSLLISLFHQALVCEGGQQWRGVRCHHGRVLRRRGGGRGPRRKLGRLLRLVIVVSVVSVVQSWAFAVCGSALYFKKLLNHITPSQIDLIEMLKVAFFIIEKFQITARAQLWCSYYEEFFQIAPLLPPPPAAPQ